MRHIALGSGAVVALGVLVCATLYGWRYLPGFLGEWIGTMIGAMTTPFLLEGSFLVIGLCIVVWLNHWRQKKEGDELVYLERVEGEDVPESLPDHAKWAVYREEPLAGETPSLLARAEGAMAIGDHATAAECIAAMEGEELRSPETLAVRIELARSTGKRELMAELEEELRLRKTP